MGNPEELIYPEKNRNQMLQAAYAAFFSALPTVCKVMAFGSFAREAADRWSDIDLLVVTEDSDKFPSVVSEFINHHPVIFHSVFNPRAEPAGGYLLGIVLDEESAFHSLDLNLLTKAQFVQPGSTDRFGTIAQLKQLHVAQPSTLTTLACTNSELSLPEVETEDDRRIGLAIHWSKKKIKQVLRKQKNSADLIPEANRLRQAIQETSPSRMVCGDALHVAQDFLTIADYLTEDTN